MTIPRSTYESIPAAPRLGAFAPFVACFLLTPPVALENSTVVYGNAASFAAIYLAGLVAGAVATRHADRRRVANALIALSAIGAGAGIGFSVIALPAPRFLLYGIVAASSGALLALWAPFVRGAFDIRTLCAGLGFTAAASLALRGFLSLSGLGANLYGATVLMMLALSLLPAISAVALATSRAKGEDPATPPPATTGGQIPAAVLCAASLAALFSQGLLFTPHYLDWEACAVFRALVDAVVAGICAMVTRRSPHASSWALEAAKALGIAVALSGLMLCVLGAACEAAGFALLGASSDVLLLALLATNSGETTEEGTTKAQAAPFFLLLLATGQGWAFAGGSMLKSWLGLGPSAFMALYLGGFLLLALALAVAFGQMWLASASRTQPAAALCPNEGAGATASSAMEADPLPEKPLANDDGKEGTSEIRDTILYASEDNMQQQQAARETAAALKVIEEHRQEALAPFSLSPRETEIALLMMDGLTIAAAAEKMGVALGTAKFHLGNIYKKAGIQSKADLIALGRRYEYEIAEREASSIDESPAEDNG